MKLEVGKKYVRRDGVVVEIVKKTNDNLFPFQCIEGHCYPLSGGFLIDLKSELDLISEYVEPRDMVSDFVSDGWGRLHGAEARIKELEAELNTYKPKPVMISEWASVFASTIGPWRRYCEELVPGCGILMIMRRETTSLPDSGVSTTYHKEEV